MKKRLFCGFALILSVIPFLGACSDNGVGGGEDGKSEQVCEHDLSRINRSEPTCLSEGNIGYYQCELCGKTYFDEKAQIELSAENIAVAKVGHTIEHYQATANVAEYWRCIGCDRYFTDEALTQQTTYRQLYKDFYHPVRLSDVTTGDIFNSTSPISPLYDDFTFRCFVSWTNAENKRLNEFPENERVQVNINLNRVGAGSRVDWYNFGVGYSKNAGLFYKPVESGDSIKSSASLTQLFLEQGGIYVVVVRQGKTVSAYFEDAEGNRRLFTSGSRFGADEAVERLAANQATGTTGWTPSVTETAVCIGVADQKCIFDKAYEA